MCPFQAAPDVIVFSEDIILSPPQITSPNITYAGSSFRVLLAGGPVDFNPGLAYTVRATLFGGGSLQADDFGSTGPVGVYKVSGQGTNTLTWTLFTIPTSIIAQQLSQVSTKFPFSIIKDNSAGRVVVTD